MGQLSFWGALFITESFGLDLNSFRDSGGKLEFHLDPFSLALFEDGRGRLRFLMRVAVWPFRASSLFCLPAGQLLASGSILGSLF